MRGSDDSFVELEISADFSIATEPLMIQVEKPEYQTSLAGVKIFPRSSTTMTKPLLIQVAPQHRNMAIFLCCGRTISGSVWRTWTANSTWWSEKLPRSSPTVDQPLMVQEAHQHLTLPAEEEILPSLSTVDKPLTIQEVRWSKSVYLKDEGVEGQSRRERQTLQL